MNPTATVTALRRKATAQTGWRMVSNAASRRLMVGRRFNAGISSRVHPRRVATVECFTVFTAAKGLIRLVTDIPSQDLF
jgi:hypothetical protein